MGIGELQEGMTLSDEDDQIRIRIRFPNYIALLKKKQIPHYPSPLDKGPYWGDALAARH